MTATTTTYIEELEREDPQTNRTDQERESRHTIITLDTNLAWLVIWVFST